MFPTLLYYLELLRNIKMELQNDDSDIDAVECVKPIFSARILARGFIVPYTHVGNLLAAPLSMLTSTYFTQSQRLSIRNDNRSTPKKIMV